jgi:hypothetical protein
LLSSPRSLPGELKKFSKEDSVEDLIPVEGNTSISVLSAEMCAKASASMAAAELTAETNAVCCAAEWFVKKRNANDELSIHHKRRKV